MEQRLVGSSGLRVSELGLGTMTWGRDTDALDAADQVRDFLDAGGTLVDTAASYGGGDAERVLGSLLDGQVDRADVVLCTKAGLVRGRDGVRADTSRRSLLGGLDASLARLGTDHVDLFVVHTPDAATPPGEVAHTLQHVVSSGRARYVGVSNHPAWASSHLTGLLAGTPAPLVALQLEYSLVRRDAERDALPAARALGQGLLAWSPLGRGVLTGKYRGAVPSDSRAASPHLGAFVSEHLDARATAVVEAVATAAAGLGRAPHEVALAWLLARTDVASAVVGARTPAQLRASLAALDLALPAELYDALDDVSAPDAGQPERWDGAAPL
ncbi:aldo/keto reductase [Luteimicrobium sp. DT211]|uniref:aldo/keto reductase n=1 Tax=Luteimicrobium sp. DT211 TaxID=3393412 RepID=UPI003CF4F846